VSFEKEIIGKARDRSAVFGIVGLGYVGLPLALEVARAGFRVIGFDVHEGLCSGINSGVSHVGDISSEELSEFTSSGRIEATTEMSRLAEADVICICVPTPLSKTRDPDVSYVVAVVDSIAKVVRSGQLVILESTTYPGTTRELLLPRLETSGLKVGEDVFLAFSPERVDPGNAVWNTRNTPKVIGGLTEVCQRVALALYGPVFETLVEVESPEAAELVKLLENTFRTVNIGLANEMAIVCDKLGVDIWDVIEAAATKPFGFMKFTPGPGLGGHCIPIDPHYLAWKMRGLNYKTRFIDVAGEVNAEMPAFWVRKVSEQLNEASKAVRGAVVLVLGVAYKKDISDTRESPALDIIRLLKDQGADVRFHDPYVDQIEDDEVMNSVEFTPEELAGADCILIATDHTEVDYGALETCGTPIVDTRNVMKSRKK
jgi:UDP-N-acetyl-D-glucosamine dehydrogenase